MPSPKTIAAWWACLVVDDVGVLVVLLHVGGDHLTFGDDPLARFAGLLECFAYEDGGQTAPLVVGVDLGVGEDATLASVQEHGLADIASLYCDRELVRFSADGGRCAGLVGVAHVIPFGLGRGRSVALGSGGAGNRWTA